MSDLIRAKLEEIVKLQSICIQLQKGDLNHKSKLRKTYNFSNYSFLLFCKRYT